MKNAVLFTGFPRKPDIFVKSLKDMKELVDDGLIVTESANHRYNRLLTLLQEKTGVGVVLNTSFNDGGEPIVRTPGEATRDFYSSGPNKLVLGDYMLENSQISEKSPEKSANA